MVTNTSNLTLRQITSEWIKDNFDINSERLEVVKTVPLGNILVNDDFYTELVESQEFFSRFEEKVLAQVNASGASFPKEAKLYLGMLYDGYRSCDYDDCYNSDGISVYGEYRYLVLETDQEVVARLKKHVCDKIRRREAAAKQKEKRQKQKAQTKQEELRLLAKLKKKYKQ